MSQRTGSSVFPANHQRYLFSRFRYIDEILGDAVQALDPRDETRLFMRVIADATPAQRKILLDHLAQLRFALKRFIESQRLEDISRTVSGLWSLRTAVIFSQTAVTELRPKYMAGYGPLDADAIEASERLVAELTTLLKRIGDYLDKGEQGDLANRVAHLDKTHDEIALLQQLERIITADGLVELRASLESLIERAAAPRYEVAVFGRVNSGKSSLLNWWLGQAVLPTGVTPVTAVPTRILHALTPRAHVKIASNPVRDFPLDELASYVTEANNPGNAKRVLEIILELPGERLNQGVCLVDTPGLGSLATAGAAQTLEYLPQCDLGIQLIEAGGAVTREDLAVARAILDGGSAVLIALSKADRLAESELSESRKYASDLFERELGISISVRAVSTLPAHAQLADEWFHEELLPRLSRHREQATVLLRRKIGALRESVVAVLAARVNSGSLMPPGNSSPQRQPIHEPVARLRAALEHARSDLLARISRVHSCTAWLVDGAAEELVHCWLQKNEESDELPERVRTSIARRADEIGEIIAGGLKECSHKLHQGLAELFTDPARVPEVPQSRGRPAYDSASLSSLTSYERPRWAFARALLLASAKDRVEAQLVPALTERLSIYAEALRLWGVRYLDALGRVVDDAVALEEAADRSRSAAPPSPDALSAMRQDLELLQQWGKERSAPGTSTLNPVQRGETDESHEH